ncbi:MAG: hypothetical protein QN193_05650 [Armatimonadota bacterium]|nr:hypothetical protein [Armatimonadota bacterium]MDR7443977.1 hypothetical protein [Armatimonadota bacterium]MDR7570075.1 hypothetical protein [Armatimonadota bacterium]MDR7615420.1 hypothetical protein [Armatimonadota bacterium]
MQWGPAAWSGLAGTAAMTVLMAMAPAMGMPRMNMMAVLGTMFLPEGLTASTLGAVVHFAMGILRTAHGRSVPEADSR